MNPGNNWKLGLFVMVGVVTLGFVLVLVGATQLERETESFVTYLDESVQGLDVGSPVKFRGVRIGEVSEITVAVDRRHVKVTAAVDVQVLRRLGLHPESDNAHDRRDGRFVPPDVRVQVVPQGITGVRFLGVDFFKPEEHPEPKLGFPTPPNYIPATISTLASVEDAVLEVAAQVPAVSKKVQALLDRADEVLQDVDWKKLSQQLIATLESTDRALQRVEEKLAPLDVAHVQSEVTSTLQSVQARLASLDEVVARLQAKDGLLDHGESLVRRLDQEAQEMDLSATVEQGRATLAQAEASLRRVDGAVAAIESTSRAVTQLAQDARRTPAELETSLRALRRAAVAVRDLAELLQRDSDMLLKGRARRD